MKNKKLRLNVNANALIKLTALVSNSLVLATNAYLLGTNVKKQLHDRKAESIANTLQVTAEVASALAGVARVVINSVGTHERS